MSWEVLSAIMMLVLFGSLLAGQWIALALGTVGILIIVLSKGLLGLSSIASVVWNTTNSYLLIAIPLFQLMGEIILRTGVSQYFYRGMAVLLRKLPGSLYHANIAACALFGASAGSSVSTAATIGTVAIPELLRRGYDRKLTYGSIAAGGTLGILIPPSIPMILYGALVDESVAKIFVAGIIPGLLLSALFSLYIGAKVVMRPELAPRAPSSEQEGNWREVLHIVPVSVLLIVVLGGIYAGIATPTESAALGVVGALVLVRMYGRITWPAMQAAVMSSVRTACMVMLIVISAQVLSAALTYSGISRGLSEAIFNLGLPKWGFFAALVGLYILLGCLVEGIAMIYITLPILYPVIVKFGFDPVWFGVVLVILIEVGQIHPPLGINLFTIQSIARDADFGEIVMGSLPFVAIILSMILFLAFFPGLATWLPSIM